MLPTVVGAMGNVGHWLSGSITTLKQHCGRDPPLWSPKHMSSGLDWYLSTQESSDESTACAMNHIAMTQNRFGTNLLLFRG